MKDEKVSKAQIEVWQWKEKLYGEIKDMDLSDALKYLIKKGEDTVTSLGLKSKKSTEALKP